jgi:PD-(D/E)XK nuclease superfamily
VVHAATTLLDDFRALPGRVERPRTFMEIAGYPHYENACSNILAFFMDPEESHGLGTLVLDALASAGKIAAADEGVGGGVSVEREVSTDDGNRIDILITSDEHAVLIENKIYAGAINPFDDYADYLDRIAVDRKKHKLLIILYPINEGSEWGFMNLTHKVFVEQIRSLLGHYVSSADARYLTIFLDFLNTLENLQRGPAWIGNLSSS